MFPVPGLVTIKSEHATGMLVSPSPTRKETSYSDQTQNFCKPLKKYSEVCPSNQVSATAITSTSDKKWRPFNCFFQLGRAKDLSAPLYRPPWYYAHRERLISLVTCARSPHNTSNESHKYIVVNTLKPLLKCN